MNEYLVTLRTTVITCGVIYDFYVIVNCDKYISDQRRRIVRYL